jgi:hypothetical protein
MFAEAGTSGIGPQPPLPAHGDHGSYRGISGHPRRSSELTAYIKKHLERLTGGDQQLGLDQRFQGDISVARP